MATVVDLFSGAGGLSLGFRAAGCEILAAIDHDEQAGTTFRGNFTVLQPDCRPQVFSGTAGDLEAVPAREIYTGPAPDIVVGGPPCQGFSRLGRGKLDSLREEGFETDPRNQLYRRFLEAVRAWRPRAVVMENVPGMAAVRGVNYAEIVAGELAECGYRTGYALLNAAWYGVPQLRERLFFLAFREALGIDPVAPATTHRATQPPGYASPLRQGRLRIWKNLLGELALAEAQNPAEPVTVAAALDDLPVLTEHLSDRKPPRGDFRRALPYRSPPHSPYAALMRRWPGLPEPVQVFDHAIRRTPRDYETFRRMQPGDRYPRAVEIAWARFEEERRARDPDGTQLIKDSPAWKDLRDRIVPPYPPDSFEDRWRKLIPEQPAWTIPAHLAKDSYSHIHHDSAQARMISIREAARLQSFPDAFAFSGNMGQCFRQIGNAVPPLLAWVIASHVLMLLGQECSTPPDPTVLPAIDQATEVAPLPGKHR